MMDRINQINIITIGQIAYYESQVCFVSKLGNVDKFLLHYAGEGPASVSLKEFVELKGYTNISFSGRYEKSDEEGIVRKYDMVNIWLKHGINADSCIANRFYLSVMMRKPMIVTSNTYQGELCNKYKLGVALDENEDFVQHINRYCMNFDKSIYQDGVNRFLAEVRNDLMEFEKNILMVCK